MNKPLVIKINVEDVVPVLLIEAVNTLKNGGLVVFPTETVYGLGALISRKDAVKKIYLVKGRPIDNPLIVHVDTIDMFLELTLDPPEEIIELAKKFWPGPLTIIWWKKPGKVPDIVTADLPKVAIRSPAHPVALELIRLSGEAIAAPSANRSGKPSPTTADHVLDDLDGLVDVVIDSGETLYGVESTVIDFTVKPPRLLRPGAMPIEKIEKVIQKKIEIPYYARGLGEAGQAESPGMKYKHYAPNAKLVIVETSNYHQKLDYLVKKARELLEKGLRKYKRVAIICSSETCSKYHDLDVEILDIGSRKNLFIVARNLFKTLRKLDDLNIEYAVVEGFEEKGLGLTIMNRLRKASGHNIIIV